MKEKFNKFISWAENETFFEQWLSVWSIIFMIVSYIQGNATEGHMWFIVAMMACGITSVRKDIKKYNTKDN